MSVCGQIFLGLRKLLCFGDQIGIRGGMRTDVEGERAVGKITRTAAGGASTLTIVWQEFRFQLCTTLLFSSSPSSPLCFSLPACICMNAVKSSIFNHLFFHLNACLSFSVSLLHIPPFAICQNHNTLLKRACSQFLKVRFDVTASGRGWEERGSCLSWP